MLKEAINGCFCHCDVLLTCFRTNSIFQNGFPPSKVNDNIISHNTFGQYGHIHISFVW